MLIKQIFNYNYIILNFKLIDHLNINKLKLNFKYDQYLVNNSLIIRAYLLFNMLLVQIKQMEHNQIVSNTQQSKPEMVNISRVLYLEAYPRPLNLNISLRQTKYKKIIRKIYSSYITFFYCEYDIMKYKQLSVEMFDFDLVQQEMV